MTGILRGAAPCFFGYVGYDEVCCLSSEVADPKRTVPRAVFGTIFAVTVIYCLASVALVGMHDYRTLDLHSGFAGAFRQDFVSRRKRLRKSHAIFWWCEQGSWVSLGCGHHGNRGTYNVARRCTGVVSRTTSDSIRDGSRYRLTTVAT